MLRCAQGMFRGSLGIVTNPTPVSCAIQKCLAVDQLVVSPHLLIVSDHDLATGTSRNS